MNRIGASGQPKRSMNTLRGTKPRAEGKKRNELLALKPLKSFQVEVNTKTGKQRKIQHFGVVLFKTKHIVEQLAKGNWSCIQSLTSATPGRVDWPNNV